MKKQLLLGCLGLLAACSSSSNKREERALNEDAYYPRNFACEDALASSKRLSPAALRNMGSSCDIITLVETQQQAGDSFSLNGSGSDLSSLQDKFIDLTSKITKSITGDQLYKKIADAIASGESLDNGENPENTVDTSLEDKAAIFVAWSEKLDMDRYNTYLEAKLVQTYNGETEKVVDYGFRLLLMKTTRDFVFKSPERIIASYLPMTSLALTKWDTQGVRSRFLNVLNSANASKEDVMRISARAYKILKDAQKDGLDLKAFVKKRALRAPSETDKAIIAIEQSQVAYETIKALAEEKAVIAKQIQKSTKDIHSEMEKAITLVEQALADPVFRPVKNTLKGHQGFSNLETILNADELPNANVYRNLLQLADQSYKILNGKVDFDDKKLAQVKLLAIGAFKDTAKAQGYSTALDNTYAAFKNFTEQQTISLPEYSSLLMDAFDVEDDNKNSLGLKKRKKLKKKSKNKLKVLSRTGDQNSEFEMPYSRDEIITRSLRAIPKKGRKKRMNYLLEEVTSMYGFVEGMSQDQADNHLEVMDALSSINFSFEDLSFAQQDILDQTDAIREGQEDIISEIQENADYIVESLSEEMTANTDYIVSEIRDNADYIIEELQAGQQQLFEGQELILDGLASLAEGQNMIMATMHEAFYEAQLESMIKHRSILENLSEIQGNINRLGEGVSAILTEDISSCQVLHNNKNNPENDFVDSDGFFNSHLDFLRFAEKNSVLMSDCMKAIQKDVTFSDPNFSGSNERFFPSLTKASITADYDYAQQYAKTFEFVSTHINDVNDLYFLVFPTVSMNAMANKRKATIDDVPENKFFGKIVASIDPAGTKNVVNPEQLIYLTHQVLNSHFYFELNSSKYVPLSTSEFDSAQASEFNNIGYEKLKYEILPMLDSGIAQRQLMRGDLSIIMLQEGLCPDSQDFFELLYTNRLLATNWVNLVPNFDTNEATVCGVSITDSETEGVFRITNPDTLAPPEKVSFALPQIDLSNELLPDPISQELDSLRDQVINQIAGYETSRSIDADQNDLFKRVILNSSVSESF